MSKLVLYPNQAIALSDSIDASPRVTARGEDELAERIIEIARKHNIPIKEEPELVKLLADVPVGEEIPDILYVAVSEVLSFARMLKEKKEIYSDS